MRLLRWFFDWPAPSLLILCGCWLAIAFTREAAKPRPRSSSYYGITWSDWPLYGSLCLLLITVGALRIRLTLRRGGYLTREVEAAQREDIAKTQHFTCPCCGYRTLAEPPGSYEVCKVCFWEDDGVQLLDPACTGGADDPSLLECQANYRRIGACEERFRRHVRAPRRDEVRDPEWRPAREADLCLAGRPAQRSGPAQSRVEDWYYWKRTDLA